MWPLFRVYILPNKLLRDTGNNLKLSGIVLNRSRNHIEDNVPVKLLFVSLFVFFFRKLVHFKSTRFWNTSPYNFVVTQRRPSQC